MEPVNNKLTLIAPCAPLTLEVSIKLPGQKVISVSLPQTLLDDIDQRAAALGLSRSAYLGLLARQDLTGVRTLSGSSPAAAPAKTVDLNEEAYAFLLRAIPALEEYVRQRDDPAAAASRPESSDKTPDSNLWQFFLLEREEILRHKYLRSTELGYDIGLSRAIQEWLRHHHALWAKAHPVEE